MAFLCHKHGIELHLFNILKVDVKLCHKARDTYTSAQVYNNIIIIIIYSTVGNATQHCTIGKVPYRGR